MRVLDLFSGLGGFSAAFRDRGHEVVTCDIEERFRPTIRADVRTLRGEPGLFDVVLASPPCQCFSVASIGKYWSGTRHFRRPRTPEASAALDLVLFTASFIEACDPRFYVVENPRGMLRKVWKRPTGTTWYCQWGDSRAKPTDFWTNVPFVWRKCRNGAKDHDSAPRGQTTGGTQGIKNTALRALIPYPLSLALCLAMEAG